MLQVAVPAYFLAKISSSIAPFRRFPLHSLRMWFKLFSGTLTPSASAIRIRNCFAYKIFIRKSGKASKYSVFTASSSKTGVRNTRQRLRIGLMIRLPDVETSMSRKFALYFSIVLRSECWASLLRRSASKMTATVAELLETYYVNNAKPLPLNDCFVLSTCCDWASSWIISWIATLSKIPTSPGENSMWWLLEYRGISNRFPEGVLNIFSSIFS